MGREGGTSGTSMLSDCKCNAIGYGLEIEESVNQSKADTVQCTKRNESNELSPVSTTRVDGPRCGNARPSTWPVLMGNGNWSPVNSGRQLGLWKPGFRNFVVYPLQGYSYCLLFHKSFLPQTRPTHRTAFTSSKLQQNRFSIFRYRFCSVHLLA